MDSENRNARMSVRAPDPVDGWLREGLAPEEDQVRRVVRHALRTDPGLATARGWDWRLPAATAALALLAWGFLSLDRHQKPQVNQQARVVQSPVALITNASGAVELVLPAAASQDASQRPGAHAPGVVEIFNRDGCMAAVLPEGRVRYWIIGGDT